MPSARTAARGEPPSFDMTTLRPTVRCPSLSDARHHIAISGSAACSFFASGISVIVASVSSRTLATETAFSSAMRTTLVGSMMPASTRSTYCLRAASKPRLPSLVQHAADHDAAVDGGVLGDLPRRRLERPAQDLHAGALVAFASRLLRLHGGDAAQQRQAAAGHDALGHRRLGGADRVVERLLLRLHLRFGRRADADHRDAAGELGQPLLQLLPVVVAGRLLDLAADLLHARVDVGALAGAADDRRVVLVDDDALGPAELARAARSRASGPVPRRSPCRRSAPPCPAASPCADRRSPAP